MAEAATSIFFFVATNVFVAAKMIVAAAPVNDNGLNVYLG